MSNPLQHFQLRMENTPETKTLYEEVFGWTFSSVTSGYENIEDIKEETTLVGQFKHEAPPTATAIIPFFNLSGNTYVSDLQTAVNLAEEAGGELVYAKFTCPVLGCSYAIIRGPEECLFGIYMKP